MQTLGLVWGNLDPSTIDLEEIRTTIEKPTLYGSKLLYDHWRAKHARDGFVVGHDVPSRPLACVLRNLAIYEPIDNAADFRVRLAGTAFIRRFGRDITGLRLSQIYQPAKFEERRSNFAEIVQAKAPRVVDVRLVREHRTFMRFEALRLPVFSPDRAVTWALAGLFFSDWT
jgi:hypothetical protein